MKKLLRKMALEIVLLILTTAVMTVTVSYAWLTLSSSPVIQNIPIAIGGGSSILIAADLTAVGSDGKVYHFPSAFDRQLKFEGYDSYKYLYELGMLSPVSTADGVNWFFAEHYDRSDPEVQNGTATVGEIKPISLFKPESNLSHANPAKGETQGYVYIDFWVVSPASDCTLRISGGDEKGGSYVIDMMMPEKADKDGDGVKETYTLNAAAEGAAAAARVGFLVNSDILTNDTLDLYSSSAGYDDKYTKLKGFYNEPGMENFSDNNQRFTIYEPNGDLHPQSENGGYTVTTPIQWNGSSASLANIQDRVTVQLKNSWKKGSTGVDPAELFETAILGKNPESVEDAKRLFYHDYLQNQLSDYVQKGQFAKSTSNLYAGADSNGNVSAEMLSRMSLAGATDDVYITKLEKNVPQKIRMFIWLEGQDSDIGCVTGAMDFILSIELAGSN